MPLRNPCRFSTTAAVALSVLLAAAATPAWGQIDLSEIRPLRHVKKAVSVRAEVEPSEAAPGSRVTLRITAEMIPEHYVYSVTQPPGGPLPTEIALDPSSRLTRESEFTPDHAPEVSREPLFDNLQVEKHHDQVTWEATFRLAPDVAPGPLSVRGTVKYLVCNPRSCTPGSGQFKTTLTIAGSSQPAPAVGANRARQVADADKEVYEHRAAKFRVYAVPSTARPGDEVTLTVEAEIESPYHIYAATQPWSPDEPGSLPTSIEVSQSGDLVPLRHRFQGPPPVEKVIFDMPSQYHEGRVSWSLPFQVPEVITAGVHPIEGVVGYMICTDEVCDPPTGFEFRGHVTIGETVDTSPAPFVLARIKNPGRVMQIVERVASLPEDEIEEPSPDTVEEGYQANSTQTGISGLPAAILFGFLAGLILNVMPCVLPVISLKVYGFVKQAGEDPVRVRLLGLMFGAGILFVFLILAGFAAFAGLGWGQQFQSDRFLVAMIALLVVFALGMFDVYAIRLPGFVNTANAASTHSEGLAGSFAKGMLATVLATPCSGPFLGATLTYALTQPPLWIFAIFTSIGMGMASPYMLLALNPNWMKILPRPGEWMNTFKEAMGFLLLATAVWLLWQRRSDGEFVIWTVAFCTFIAFAVWLYGRWSLPNASETKRWAAPVVALSIIGFGAYFCYSDLLEAAPTHWEPFSRERLETLQEEGKTVVVDWTADW